jgi:uncharacterized membrane protein YfcA
MNRVIRSVWVIYLVCMAAGVIILTIKPELHLAGRYFEDTYSIYGILVLLVLALFCEYVDSSLGMGYGTTLTPILIIAGFKPLDIVPAVLFSELLSGISAGLLHHQHGNVSFVRGSRALNVAIVLAVCSIVGTVAAVFLAVNIPTWALKGYIGILILSMGILIIVYQSRELGFSWRRITGIGIVAAFNKGMSGGGYGPVVTSGQILSGINEKNAIGITSLAEGLTCIVGLLLFIILKGGIEFRLALPLAAGAMLSVPIATWTVKVMPERLIKASIGYFTLFLGVLTLLKLVL